MDVVIYVGCFIGGVGEVGFLGVPEVGGDVVTEVAELEGDYFPHDDYEKMRDWQENVRVMRMSWKMEVFCRVVVRLENRARLANVGAPQCE